MSKLYQIEHIVKELARLLPKGINLFSRITPYKDWIEVRFEGEYYAIRIEHLSEYSPEELNSFLDSFLDEE